MNVIWDKELASECAREAYRFVARVYPSDASLQSLDVHQDAALQAQAAGDFDAYENALRGMMRTALEVKAARRGAA
jgi:hypothetical protein